MPSAARPPHLPPAPASHEAAPPKGPAGGRAPARERLDDDEPLADLPDDDLPPLPPAEGDDEGAPPPHEGLEPALPPGGDAGLDDSLADDLPVGRAIADLGAPAGADDGALGLGGGDEGDPLDEAPPALGDEGEGFEGGEEGGLPDDGADRPFVDDGGEGPGGAIEGLDVDSLPSLEPDDDEAAPPSELPALPPTPDEAAARARATARGFRAAGPYALPFAAQALAALDDGTLAVAGAGLALFGGTPPSPRGVFHPFDEGAPAVALCADAFRPGALLLVDRRLDVYAFDAARALASPRPPLPGPPLAGAAAPALFRLEGPRLVAWHPSGLTLSLGAGGHWARFFHVPFVAFAADGARACAGLAESIEGRPRLHLSTDGGASFAAYDVPQGLGAAPAGAPSPWLLSCHGALVLLGRPGRGLWASPEPGDWRRVPGGEAVLALAPPGAGPLALVSAPGGGAALVRADGEGARGPLAALPEAFDGPGARLAWDAAGRRLWIARGRALMALEPPPS
ncbi:MAG TPA: hypothetical protein VFS43_45535 [Polyangiaceae bacterium]|nr:hypothetical protein [Polyangiaceae bacterium]